MAIQVTNPSTKIHLARKGPAKVFGREVDQREELTDNEAVEWFDRVWRLNFSPAMRRARECELAAVREKVPRGSQMFINQNAEHREIMVLGCLFIAQLPTPDSCDQLWFIPSSSADPRTLYVRFDTVDEREAFAALSCRLEWDDNELGLQLIRDFMAKHVPRP